ncbi:hypothetical protein JTB14_018497 [Gonioctena quinquepunctata]|nr:hypothetical protein JTB14_018497 [Gonioctena quinquepunctata]
MSDHTKDFRLERGFTLEDALNVVYEDDIDVREIFIESPDANVLTDEESGEEDEGGTIDNLNRQQLSAHVEVKIIMERKIIKLKLLLVPHKT